MTKQLRIAVCLGMSWVWVTGTARVAHADPPQYCRDLATQYATAPDQLDANALAALRACERAESQERADPPSPAASSAQPPASPGATPIDQPGWGQWSPPPAWSDDRIKSRSWDDH